MQESKINTLIIALWAAALATALQASTVLVKATPVRWQALIGTLIVSGGFGGFSTVILLDQFHVAPFVSGALGAVTGLIPAPVVIARINEYIDARARKAIGDAGGDDKPGGTP